MPVPHPRRDGSPVRLTPTGDLDFTAVAQLLTAISEVLVRNRHDDLTVNLDLVDSMDIIAVHALLLGYSTAIEYGTSYRVINAHGQEDFRKLFAYAFNAIHTPGRPPVWLRCVTLRGIPPATAGSPF